AGAARPHDRGKLPLGDAQINPAQGRHGGHAAAVDLGDALQLHQGGALCSCPGRHDHFFLLIDSMINSMPGATSPSTISVIMPLVAPMVTGTATGSLLRRVHTC